MFTRGPRRGEVPILNSACPWASSEQNLATLWANPFTSAITTRTATLDGFPDHPELHQVAFFGPDAHSSINSYGYSPHPLRSYLTWLRALLAQDQSETHHQSGTVRRKQVIVSITGSLQETRVMLEMLQRFANEVGEVIAVEFNASCPNIPGHPPPAYHQGALAEYMKLLASFASRNLLVGVKLPPFTYQDQFEAVVAALRSVGSPSEKYHPIAFLTATNTLGQGLVFANQETPVPRDPASSGRPLTADRLLAMPPSSTRASAEEDAPLQSGWGGLAGSTVHPLALGNVARRGGRGGGRAV
ncbi:dihydroorotate dehydrogenase [Rhodotorula mucilaginosa]|uniref:Dihydroorotate dehydrogenase n=1 Tax=Rhodotorula mucilaginosa TaxID=5537 RepID=A0A9P7B6X6_RHOMI|nr:dihydroorotate dehydrogenase [Rhodotorula mucilaginosa]